MELIFTIAAGVVLGGLVLIYRNWLMSRAVDLLVILKSNVRRMLALAWSVRLWLFALAGLIGLIGLAGLFVSTAEETTFRQWQVNLRFKSEMRAACEQRGLNYWSATRGTYYCAGDDNYAKMMYLRGECLLVTYDDDEMIASVDNQRCIEARRRN